MKYAVFYEVGDDVAAKAPAHFHAHRESREAVGAAMPGRGIRNEVTHPGERGPREYFHLIQLPSRDGPAGRPGR
jgi:hypothetical protein